MNGKAAAWVKASKSDATGNCVELRRDASSVQVRDSKNPDGGVLAFSPVEMAAWLAGAKGGEFDGLIGA
jgi:hypothetical protein